MRGALTYHDLKCGSGAVEIQLIVHGERSEPEKRGRNEYPKQP
jgi:hypothetical protein